VLTGLGPSAPLTAVSDTEFSAAGATFKFTPKDDGAVEGFLLRIVEGDINAVRK
jgi:hypothetical protein